MAITKRIAKGTPLTHIELDENFTTLEAADAALTAADAAHAALTAAHGVSGDVVGTTDTQTLSNKTLSSPAIDGTVTTTGLTLPAHSSGAINGTTIPSSKTLADTDSAQALTNKTIVAASNTVTTAASGNLAATELNAALAELQGDIDTRATSAALAASSGSSLVGFLQAGTGATARTAQAKMRDSVSVKDFGAVGDGVTDDTSAIQAAIDYAATIKAFVHIPDSTFALTEARIKSGCRGLVGSGTLKGTSATPEGVVTTNGVYYGGSVVDNVLIAVNIDCNNTAKRGIFASSLTNSNIERCVITNLNTSGGAGIRLHYGCINNNIAHNKVVMAVDSPFGTISSLIGIQVVAETNGVDSTGGISTTGAPVYESITTYRTIVHGNYVSGGTHGIAMYSTAYFTINGNICEGQSHRNVICSPTAYVGSISGNTLLGTGSAGVHIALGCYNIAVTGNTINSANATYASGDSHGVGVYLYCYNINVSGNTVKGNFKYGVYFAYSFSCVISGNVLNDTSISNAGICIDSAWASPLPSGTLYTHARSLAYSVNTSTYDINISGNVCNVNASTGAAIALHQLSTKTLQRITMTGNTVSGGVKFVHVFEETSGNCVYNTISDMATPRTSGKYTFTRGRGHFSVLDNVTYLQDDSTTVTITDGDTTPSVLSGPLMVCANTTATSITDFDDGVDGQEITVKLDVNTTLVNNSALMRLKGSVNIVGSSANNMVGLRSYAGIWFETWRNF